MDEKERQACLNLFKQYWENTQATPTQADFDFLGKILETIRNKATQDEIFQLLEQNIDKINPKLHRALQIWGEKTLPTLELNTQLGIGYCIGKFSYLIQQFPSGTRRTNLEIAISGYKIFLTILSEVDFPYEWAMAQNGLGIAYWDRIAEDKRENIELAIAAYTKALRICTKANFSLDWAMIQNNLGNAYLNRVAGDIRENIELAIAAYTKILQLQIYSETNHPYDWAMTQRNFGTAYSQRVAGDKKENLELAIVACNKALQVYTEVNYPDDWAMTQNNLGLIYLNRVAGNKKENLELAIVACNNALQVYARANSPYNWAMAQINLGNAYLDRVAGDKKENLELAIVACNNALQIYTQNSFPLQWAMAQNNLGIAYWNRASGDRVKNYSLAIVSFKSALQIYTKASFPYEWARTHLNLGAVYWKGAGGDRQEDLELAIVSLKSALQIYTKANYPYEWAGTQHNLGSVYWIRVVEDRAKNIESAIDAFELSLQIRTRIDFPYGWAITQNNLGLAYWMRISGDRKENIRLAIKSFQAALTEYTSSTNPIECLKTARNLGNVNFYEEQWELAIKAYIVSIEAVEQSREWAINDRNKQEIISNAIAVYQNIVQACINLGQVDKAIEYVERGKARNLVDLLATKDLYPKGDIPEEIIVRLRTLRQEATAEEKRLSQQRSIGNSFNSFDSGENRSFTNSVSRNKILDTTRLNRIRQELDNFVAEHIKDPSFQLTQKVEPIDFEQIQATLPTQQTALIEWFIGNGTLSAFIVTPQQSMPVHFSYTEEQLNVLVNTVVQYFDSYLKRDRSWQTVLPDLLIQLAENLQIEAIVEQIKLLIPNCDRLILVPHRWLHLLPIHALPLADDKCLLDLFSQGVSYAPSVQLLQITQTQNKQQLTNFFAVQNPTGDLDFTNIEVQAVRSQFKPHDDVLAEQKATKSALTKEKLRQANLTHFSCHGKFNFENPELSALLLANSKVETSIEKEDKEDGETRYLPNRDGGSIDLEQCLTLGEIFSYDLTNCRLVTLSACETGLTDFKSLSDEYIGLPSGFLYAGSPSVVSSLWAVSDISTSFLMIKFYQNLQEIDSVAIALNQAQLWLRSVTKENLQEWVDTLDLSYDEMEEELFAMDEFLIKMDDNSRPFSSPYHWAAFCAVGS